MGVTGTSRRLIVAGTAVLTLLLATGTVAAMQSDDDPGSSGPTGGASGGLAMIVAEGDPAIGAYFDVRLPIAEQWLAGSDVEAHYQFAEPAEDGDPEEPAGLLILASASVERELSRPIGLPTTLSFRAGGRLGFVWERGIPTTRRGEIYPLLGVRAAAQRTMGRRVAVELRVTADALPALQFGVGAGVSFRRAP